MTVLQIFRKDRKYWTSYQIEQIELFFMLNTFFGKFYEHQDFEKVVNLTFYCKLNSEEDMKLEVNKKSQIVILLSGQIEVYRKSFATQRKKIQKRKDKLPLFENYIKIGQYNSAFELIETRNDTIIRSKQGYTSQFLFVPMMLYQDHCVAVNNRRVNTILQVLFRIFGNAEKRDLKALAQSSCSFKQFKMNSYIYRSDTVPEFAYILLQGNVKIQASGFSAKKMQQMLILGAQIIFGDRDLNEQLRFQNAICCAAHCKVMLIAKQGYNRLLSRNPHLNQAYAQKLRQLPSINSGKTLIQKYQQQHLLPRINRFHSNLKPEEEEKIEKEIVKNCHILMDLSPKRRAQSSFRLPTNMERDYSVSQFQRKVDMFNRAKKKGQFNDSFKLF